jgi:hypothetical protein
LSSVYSADLSQVASEVIDGEAIIMNLANGMYHSASGVAAIIWQAILDGSGDDDIATALAGSFPGNSTDEELAAFIDALKAAGLVTETQNVPSGVTPDFGGVIYAPPMLETYGDMQDLIRLDPIHDVSEQHGWPVRPIEVANRAENTDLKV